MLYPTELRAQPGKSDAYQRGLSLHQHARTAITDCSPAVDEIASGIALCQRHSTEQQGSPISSCLAHVGSGPVSSFLGGFEFVLELFFATFCKALTHFCAGFHP